jgi:hypothetical protein
VQGLIKRYCSNGLHTRTSGLHWLSVLSIGSEGRLVIFSRQHRPDRTVGEEPFVYAPFSGCQMPLTLGYPTLICKDFQRYNREGNASGRLIGEELFPSPFPTDERFSPVGRWFSHNSDCQDVAVLLKYGCGVRFGFCCYFSAALSQCSFAIIGDFLVGYVPLLSLVFLPLYFPLWCLSFSPLQLTRPHPFVTSLFALFPSFHSRRPSLSLHHILTDPFSEHGVALLNTEEGRVNG